ncbi:DUF2934 domain-containing protein [Nitratireductor sp. GCM10026969]|uniref:DUF2934 domain-containing protein n=1 Tax=Nitratireductor sp. GCM10026969 TaxID=3252645 RepID=UPI0036120CBE
MAEEALERRRRTPDMIPGNEDKIRARAYEIWEQEGRPSGRAEEHWEKARREIEDGQPAAVPEPGEGETEPLAHGLGDPDGSDVAPGPQVGEADVPQPPKRTRRTTNPKTEQTPSRKNRK